MSAINLLASVLTVIGFNSLIGYTAYVGALVRGLRVGHLDTKHRSQFALAFLSIHHRWALRALTIIKASEHEYVREERSWCESQPARNPTEQSQAGRVAPCVGKPAQGLHPGPTGLQDTPTQAWLPRVAEPPVRQRSLQWPFRPPQASV